MSHKQVPPRQDRRKAGRSSVKRHAAAAGVGTEGNTIFNPPEPKSKRERAGLQAGLYNARKKQRNANNG